VRVDHAPALCKEEQFYCSVGVSLKRSGSRRARLLPVEEHESACVIAMADPLDDEAAAAVAFVLGL